MAATSSPWAPNSKRAKLDEVNLEAIQRYWPESAIKEILVRLPVKSILKFKSGCKAWYFLIRSRYFIDFHRSRRLLHNDHRNELFFSLLGKLGCHIFTMDCSSQSTPLFDVGILLKAVKDYNLDEILHKIARYPFGLSRTDITEICEPNIKVLGPLKNGIYCVITEIVVKNGNFSYGYCNPAFCNPATGYFKLISPPPCAILEYPNLHYGFGSIQKANVVVDYKMVVICEWSDQSIVFLYSLRRGSWERVCNSFYLRYFPKALAALVQNGKVQFPKITQDLDFLPQAFLNGSCHWMGGHSVLQFDMTSEVFGSFAGPPKDYCNLPRSCWVKRGVFAFNDHLFAIFIIYEPISGVIINHEIDVWMMMEYGVAKSWTKIHSSKFQYEGNLRKFLGMFFSKESQGIDKMFFQDKKDTFLSYDCSTYIIRKNKFDTYGRSWACWKTIGLSEYCETLEPVSLDVHD